MTRHKVFVSYHHKNDQKYRNDFEDLFANQHDIMISKSVQIGDIDTNLKTDTIRQKIRDEYLRDSTVTIVLIGSQTWQRKHVDWKLGQVLGVRYIALGQDYLVLFCLRIRVMTQKNTTDIPFLQEFHDEDIECGFASIHNLELIILQSVREMDSAVFTIVIILRKNGFMLHLKGAIQ